MNKILKHQKIAVVFKVTINSICGSIVEAKFNFAF